MDQRLTSNMKNLNLVTLWAEAKNGSDDAIMAFLEAAEPIIKSVLEKIGLDDQDAEEALQDTYLALIEKINDGVDLVKQGSESFFALRLQDMAEKAAASYQRMVIEIVPLAEATEEAVELATDDGLSEQLDMALQTLTERERDVITKRSEGCTLKSIAAELGIHAERVRQIEAKALRKLRCPSRSRRLEDYLV